MHFTVCLLIAQPPLLSKRRFISFCWSVCCLKVNSLTRCYFQVHRGCKTVKVPMIINSSKESTMAYHLKIAQSEIYFVCTLYPSPRTGPAYSHKAQYRHHPKAGCTLHPCQRAEGWHLGTPLTMYEFLFYTWALVNSGLSALVSQSVAVTWP